MTNQESLGVELSVISIILSIGTPMFLGEGWTSRSLSYLQLLAILPILKDSQNTFSYFLKATHGYYEPGTSLQACLEEYKCSTVPIIILGIIVVLNVLFLILLAKSKTEEVEGKKVVFRMLFSFLSSLTRWFSLPVLVLSMAILFNSGKQNKDTLVGASFGVAMVLLGEWLFIMMFNRVVNKGQTTPGTKREDCCQVLKQIEFIESLFKLMIGAALVFSRYLGLANIVYLIICLMPVQIMIFYCIVKKKKEITKTQLRPHSRTFLFFTQSFIFGIALLLYANKNSQYFQKQTDAILTVILIFLELLALIYYYTQRLFFRKEEEEVNPEGGLSMEKIEIGEEKGEGISKSNLVANLSHKFSSNDMEPYIDVRIKNKLETSVQQI